MKTLKLVTAILLAAGISACAQNKKPVPTAIQNAFLVKFPDAKKVKWDKENKMEWEAEFKMDGKEYSANFLADGTWKETEYEIKKAAIPATIKQTLDTEFAGYEIEEAEFSKTADGQVYEFEIEKGKTNMEVAIDKSGKVVKREEQQEEEKDND
ncbi:PepSY-like domain-containing protein [Ancylomarina longa]|uniref:Putative beta-lactamase-inhibitor-like PepSY-like domain-containing protein n=1 Tax=Ancylomarina longa TaxID=2487017 RepID=A0A434AER5_9BACT|nr:PepSY-like domain-containing protein [Ancylomarina longa]RUT72856.1 hypothetical protein DLK05_16355 [Ancylomarina longa]